MEIDGSAIREVGVDRSRRLFTIALALAVFTVVYNTMEGIVSILFGLEDECLSLFGFGMDSFIEVVSGLGIIQMVTRIQRNPGSNRSQFERKALRITGFAFYALVGGLVIGSGYNIVTAHQPETTFWGLVVSVVSIAVMGFLVYAKTSAGKQLGSDAILADAQCTKVCIYMSLILLVSSAFFALTGIGYVDAVGTLGLAYFCFREGRECFQKAKSNALCGCNHCDT